MRYMLLVSAERSKTLIEPVVVAGEAQEVLAVAGLGEQLAAGLQLLAADEALQVSDLFEVGDLKPLPASPWRFGITRLTAGI
ncbi:hypothetical protein GPNCGGLF_LOCUS4112 [Methylorubrum aminovorans]